MNWVDILIIAFAVIGAYIGWKHGLVRTVVTVIGLILGIALAGQWSEGLAEALSPRGAQWAYLVAFAIIVIAVLIIANIAGKVVQTFLKLLMLGWIDSLGGIILGFITGILAAAAVLTSMALYINDVPGARDSSFVEAIGNSGLANLLIDNFGLLLSLLPGKFDSVKELFQ